jgi:hypothetical protein
MRFEILVRRKPIFGGNVVKWRQLIFSAGLGVWLAACAGAPVGGGVSKESSAEARQAAVTQRANARWAALIKGDVDGSYQFLSPASREVTTPEQYRAKTRAAGFREVAVEKVDCEAEICKLRLKLTYDHRMMKGLVTPIEETWVLEQGQFWLVYRG